MVEIWILLYVQQQGETDNSSVFLFLDFKTAALLDPQFKITVLYHTLVQALSLKWAVNFLRLAVPHKQEAYGTPMTRLLELQGGVIKLSLWTF